MNNIAFDLRSSIQLLFVLLHCHLLPPRCIDWVERSDWDFILLAELRPTMRAAVKDGPLGRP